MKTRARVLIQGTIVSIAAIVLVLTVAVDPAQASMPTVGAFSPSSGSPGTIVAVSGTGFTGGSGVTAVTFNGVATTFDVADDQHLSTTVPFGATTGKIGVTTSDGTGTSSSNFTVPADPAPTISGFSPSSGVPGTAVTINGNHFTGVTSVAFNGTSATFNLINDGQVSTTVPLGATTGKISLTTPAGTGTTSGSFTVTGGSVPTFSGFSPNSGPVGTLVTINGNHFTGVTSVKFNGTSAAFSFVNDNRVTATVPSGATTGKISLTTPAGTGTTSSSFTVTGGGTHERSISLSISGRYASGFVRVNDGYSACSSNVPVVIKRLRHGEWHWVTTTSTASDGRYRAFIGRRHGRYRSRAKQITLVNGAICGGDQSEVIHRRPS